MTEAGQQLGQRGQALYNQTIKAQVEEGNHAKFLILDINTGDYEVDPEDLTASERLLARRPDAVLFGVRIGYPAAYRLGGNKQGSRADNAGTRGSRAGNRNRIDP